MIYKVEARLQLTSTQFDAFAQSHLLRSGWVLWLSWDSLYGILQSFLFKTPLHFFRKYFPHRMRNIKSGVTIGLYMFSDARTCICLRSFFASVGLWEVREERDQSRWGPNQTVAHIRTRGRFLGFGRFILFFFNKRDLHLFSLDTNIWFRGFIALW